MFGIVNVDCISTYLNAALTDSRINTQFEIFISTPLLFSFQ